MIKFSFSFPGKIILFGEHAVVYGETAIATAISKRMYANCKLFESDKSSISVKFENTITEIDPFKPIRQFNDETYQMIHSAFENNFPKNRSLDIHVIQDFPTGGLGSSAALCACIAAISAKVNNLNLNLDSIFEKTKELEKFYHGNPSGIDPATVVYGGGIKMENNKISKVKIPEIPLLIVGTNRERNTKTAVSHVRELIQKYPNIYKPMIKSIGDISRTFLNTSDDTKSKALFDLFTPANELLNSFGLNCPESDEIAKIASENGLAAKISGAGMGGIMLVTGPDLDKKEHLFSKYNIIKATIGAEGMRDEIPNFD